MDMTGRLQNGDISKFLYAGNATFTLRSARTGTRYTYKVQTPKTVDPLREVHFVKVLTGQDNTGDYSFFGTIFGRREFRTSRKSRLADSAPSVQAFRWFIERVLTGTTLPDGLEIYHEGRCGRCGRALTVPESVLTGFGPECSDKLGVERVEVPVPLPSEPSGNVAEAHPAIERPERKAHRENRRRLAERPAEIVDGIPYGEWAEAEAARVGL